ncbi:MAG: TolC family protein [Caulobacter sp.]|nr:TolC family protein [Caulobacter sp.]
MPSPYLSRCAVFGAAAMLLASFASSAFAEPVTLAQALDRAQAGSPLITAAEADVWAAEGRARQAGLLPNPEIDLSTENVGGTGSLTGVQAAETTLSVGQRFELGGKRSARLNAAQAEVAAARLRLRIARADLAKEVREAFAHTIAARRRVDQARKQFVRAESLQKIAVTLVEAGREPPLRALRARTVTLEAVGRVRAAEADYAAAQRALAALWGGSENAPDPVAGEEAVPAPSVDPTAVLDVRLAEAELATAIAAERRERTLSRPDVTVSVGGRRLAASGETAMVVGLSMPLGLFDRNQGNIAAANADRTGADARRNAAMAAALRRTRDALAGLQTADARLEFLEKRAEPEVLEAVRIAREGFAAGRFTLLDVLDAEAALNSLQSDLITAELDRALALAALVRANGTEGTAQ